MREIADGVRRLSLTPYHGINAYLIGDVLVDTGIKQSAATITKILDGRNISAIALTHAHPDHAGAIRRLASQFNAPVWCGAADRNAAETGRVVLSPALRRPRLSRLVYTVAGPDGVPVARSLVEGDALTDGFVVYEDAGAFPRSRLVLARVRPHPDLRRRVLQGRPSASSRRWDRPRSASVTDPSSRTAVPVSCAPSSDRLGFDDLGNRNRVPRGVVRSGDGALLAQAMRDEMAVIYVGLNLDAWHMSKARAAELGPPRGAFLGRQLLRREGPALGG